METFRVMHVPLSICLEMPSSLELKYNQTTNQRDYFKNIYILYLNRNAPKPHEFRPSLWTFLHVLYIPISCRPITMKSRHLFWIILLVARLSGSLALAMAMALRYDRLDRMVAACPLPAQDVHCHFIIRYVHSCGAHPPLVIQQSCIQRSMNWAHLKTVTR